MKKNKFSISIIEFIAVILFNGFGFLIGSFNTNLAVRYCLSIILGSLFLMMPRLRGIENE